MKRPFLPAGVITLAASLLLPAAPAKAAEPPSGIELARQLNRVFVDIAERVSGAVVVIHVAHKPVANEDDGGSPLNDFFNRRFRRQFEEENQREQEKKRTSKKEREPIFDSQGSGVVIREEGYILTNRHVVDGAEKIKVRFQDGTEFPAEVRGKDPQSDVAVIKIDPRGRKLTVAKLGDSNKVRVGEYAIAIGAPFELDYSVTIGHVSAKGRSRIIQDMAMDQDFIQTDASINPGNSGGPLVNIDGEVVGINTLIRGLRTGIGFAIPSNLAREVSDKLITEGRFPRSRLGIGIKALSDYPEFKSLVPGVTDGVVVISIEPDGPASKSDLKASDVITAVDGKKVATSQELKNEIRTKKIGQTVNLDIIRKGQNTRVALKTGEYTDEDPAALAKSQKPSEEEERSLGMVVKTLTRELAKEYEITSTEGVVVVDVEPDSAAARKGIQAGDVITEVNHKKILTQSQFKEAIKESGAGKGVIINLISQGIRKFEVIKEGEK